LKFGYKEKALAFEFILKDYMLEVNADNAEKWAHWDKYRAGSGCITGNATRIQELRFDREFKREIRTLIQECIRKPHLDCFDGENDVGFSIGMFYCQII